MGKFVKLNPTELKALRDVDPRLVSYNVEMTEVTGGTFWKAYTPEQVEEMFSIMENRLAEVKGRFAPKQAKNNAFSFGTKAE